MTEAFEFDEHFLTDLERLYRTESMAARRAFVRDLLGPEPGESVLSLGVGPGFEPRGLARAVGEGGIVLGVDTASTMLAETRERCSGLPQTAFTAGDATDLPVRDGTVGKAAAVQVYEYVPDVAAAASELRRVLAPGGRAVVVDTDWGTVAFNVADRTRSERVLAAYGAHCLHPRLPRTLGATLERAGLDLVDVQAFTHVETEPGGVGDQVATMAADFVAAGEDVPAETAEAWRADLDERAAAGEFYFSYSQYAFVVEKPRE